MTIGATGRHAPGGAEAPDPAAAEQPDDRLDHAALLVQIGELYDAEAEVTDLLAEKPDDVGALDLVAKIKHMRGELTEALATWAQVHARLPQQGMAQARLGTILQLAKESAKGGTGEFVPLGANTLWRKPAVTLELEGVFRLFLARQPDEARSRCDHLAAKYRSRDADLFKLSVLAKSWIAELTGDFPAARAVLEELGKERGFDQDTDRLSALARLYEQDGTPELLSKAVNIYRFFAREGERVSVLGHLASLSRRLGRGAEAAAWESRFLDLFRRRMHRPTFAAAIRVAARRYVPLAKLVHVRFPDTAEPERPTQRQRAIALALRGDERGAGELLDGRREVLDLKYRADLRFLEGDTDGAVALYLESLEADPGDARIAGWLLGQQTSEPHPGIEAWFARPDAGRRAVALLESELRESPLRPSLWRQLEALHRILGHADEAERCTARAAALDEALARRSAPVGRVLAAAVYHFGGRAHGIVHEVWAARRPVSPGRGGFLDEVLGNLTPEMSQSARNTFLSVREYARAKWPHRTEAILDYDYAFKVTKDDEPSGGLSAGLPSALAFLSVFLDRPVPQDVACSGELVSDSHDVLVVKPIGEPDQKVRGAYNRDLRRVILPEGNRRELEASALVPAAVCGEIVRTVRDLDDAVVLVFGEDVFVR